MKDKIIRLKKEKGALILAHYYQPMEIQEVADHVGDSYALALLASKAKESTIIMCGVHFMAESAKILNPQKKVLIPVLDAGCPMADMITADEANELRKEHPDAAVVCYVNSSAEVKAVSDVCCTSSSALDIVKKLPQQQIIFIPDKNLGSYIAEQVPEKDIILYDGCCPIHNDVLVEHIASAKAKHPDAKLLMHPECPPEAVRLADYVGSTAGILQYVANSDTDEFIIGTESGIIDRLNMLYPEKKFYPLKPDFICSDMKKIPLDKLLACLENEQYEITIDKDIMEKAAKSLERMISI